ncbi:glycoside hydrolase family protein [Niabella pedocola]|uniref:Glycoside hydrolase family protein n=1 Tax=Niabella pedocola TaxID=1752077 RepID=A0ABS8PL83_9BACT|nr:glycoside hydrolase family protein [Niabella pedocola]MCD2421863.1 glycoside hydrolase family protein [Niabella pedocola]
MEKKSCFLAVLLWWAPVLFAQDDLNLQSRMPAVVHPSALFVSDSFYTWCSSVIKGEDGRYHMFYSRWPHGTRTEADDSMNYIFNGFSGWLKYSEIAYAVADKAAGPYHYVKTILRGSGNAGSWDRYTMHNPQIRKFGSYYYLYYISNSFDTDFHFSDNRTVGKDWLHWLKYNCTQKIGVIKAASLTDLISGRFQKPPGPLMQPDNEHTFEVATNPSVTSGPDNKYYMMFKSRRPDVGHMTMWMAVSDQPDRPFRLLGQVFTTADLACEDPYLWYDRRRKRFYAVVKYYSNDKVLAPQFGALALVTSKDGLHWNAATHSLVALRKLKIKGRPAIELAHLERPFLLQDKNGNLQALFAAASIKEPGKGDATHTGFEYNSFNICFPLSKK